MRRRDVRKANQRFMWATMAMAVVVLMVVGLFLTLIRFMVCLMAMLMLVGVRLVA